MFGLQHQIKINRKTYRGVQNLLDRGLALRDSRHINKHERISPFGELSGQVLIRLHPIESRLSQQLPVKKDLILRLIHKIDVPKNKKVIVIPEPPQTILPKPRPNNASLVLPE
jgi:hypothetical protein